ncbi:hypothetical protein DL98DRAFT_211075 [Cadophora sp. DSE1049]|nr:hypothetical protein DL98DRAFT_211075 [Cadophora sp. DSE1049]
MYTRIALSNFDAYGRFIEVIDSVFFGGFFSRMEMEDGSLVLIALSGLGREHGLGLASLRREKCGLVVGVLMHILQFDIGSVVCILCDKTKRDRRERMMYCAVDLDRFVHSTI